MIRVLMVVLVAVGSGCGPHINYVLMQSELNDPGHDDRPEITSTAEAQNVLPRVRRVAVRAPDACASQSAAETTGAANNRGSIVQTDCGVEMAELERALTRAGYQVYSWKQIQSMSRNTPAELAARQLGAEVLFQVNSLERVTYLPSPTARWNRGFFTSDAEGSMGGEPFSFKQTDLTKLEPYFAGQERLAMQRLGAMLDLNAVATDTGQTLWFYRRVRFQQPGSPRTQVLVKKGKNGWGPPPAAQPPTPRSSATQSQPVGNGVQRIDAAYFELMRNVVAEFATQFAQGQAPQARGTMLPLPPPPPPPAPSP